ncbi:MAG TPA: SDR family oxidoreductase [Streptomyces sp.]|uniref:SDR family NAD(P)-dependent oxidoreductase n=1 Tax=Streptomyces sp. TaxID=1931 RepID=UPI002C71581A|nr:SDR family oxidoreductase [Streptomyces sp.]HWU07640.1 SDR family oxidoreductase [Streptomyces sp.]
MTGHPFDLTGRVVWVTGAGKGLGRAMAVALSRAGARVAVSSRTADDLDGLAAELAAEGGQIDVHPLSVADPGAVRATADAVVERAGRLDGLVNCAGISPDFTRSERLDDATWTRILDVNLSGTFYCCREAGRIMLGQSGGSIVNVSSVHATAGFGRLAAYSASKGAVEALTRTLAVEWAERGIRVNTLAPGYFDTELSKPLMSNNTWADRVKSAIPMARTGDPDELSGAVVFLMSDASRYTTGSTLTVDGGWTAW